MAMTTMMAIATAPLIPATAVKTVRLCARTLTRRPLARVRKCDRTRVVRLGAIIGPYEGDIGRSGRGEAGITCRAGEVIPATPRIARRRAWP